MVAPTDEPLDPRRWFAASVAIVSVAIPVLDNTILNLAVPTILREFHTQLSSLQWVITGYSLTFATLLIIGGRLGDIFGHRRMFVLGAAIFGVGSFLASISTSVPTLFVGEALIEGIGASMMIPATLSILSTTFKGAERPKAFAAWGAVAGAAVAFGPIVGGFLTTDYSWRWAFRINVIVAPIIVIGALLFMHPDERGGRRPHIDVRGAALIAVGSFSLIFGLSEGTTYGWWNPIKDLTVGSWNAWPATRAVSVIPFAFVLSRRRVHRVRRRRAGDGARQPRSAVRVRPAPPPGVPLRPAHDHGARDGPVRAACSSSPCCCRTAKHLSALRAGEWMLPQGILIALAAPIGGRLTRRFSITSIVRTGLALESIGLLLVALAISPHVSFLALLPGHDRVRPRRRLRELAAHQRDPLRHRSGEGGRRERRQHDRPPGRARARHRDVRVVHRRRRRASGSPTAVANGARPAMLFAAAVVAFGAGLSFLIPRVTVARNSAPEEVVGALESIDVDPSAIG